jgi:hypothetical protein
MEPIGFPETSVRNYHYWLRNNPESAVLSYFVAEALNHAVGNAVDWRMSWSLWYMSMYMHAMTHDVALKTLAVFPCDTVSSSPDGSACKWQELTLVNQFISSVNIVYHCLWYDDLNDARHFVLVIPPLECHCFTALFFVFINKLKCLYHFVETLTVVSILLHAQCLD